MASGDYEFTTLVSEASVNGSDIKCGPRDDYTFEIVELVFSAATFPIHFYVFIAMLAYRDIVKRNIVNAYAGNVIFTSVVSNAWRIYVNGYTLGRRHAYIRYTEELYEDHWEAFKQALKFVMMLVTSGSIGLMINAMRSIQFRVHKTVGGVANMATQESCERKEKCSRTERVKSCFKDHPKSWAGFYICLIWLIPLLLTMFSALFNSCEYGCHCDDGQVPQKSNVTSCEEINESDACSSLLPPISRVTLDVGFALWLVYLGILTFSLFKTNKDLKLLTKRRCESNLAALNENQNQIGDIENGENPDTDSNKSLDGHETAKLTTENEQSSVSQKPPARRTVAVKISGNDKPCTRVSGSIFVQSLRKNFKLLLIMYLAYLIGTSPIAIVALLDGIMGSLVHDVSYIPREFVIFTVLPIFAEAICTVIVCMYLSGVKAAARSLAVKIGRC